MNEYGIQFCNRSGNFSRYRLGGSDDGPAPRWNLTEAEKIAYQLFERLGTHTDGNCAYVMFGNGDHEFRIWGAAVAGQDSWGNFDGPNLRWAPWYVDVEINGHRWRYRPVADLRDYADADELAEYVAELHPHVTRVWVGASDGSEEFEHETREG